MTYRPQLFLSPAQGMQLRVYNTITEVAHTFLLMPIYSERSN